MTKRLESSIQYVPIVSLESVKFFFSIIKKIKINLLINQKCTVIESVRPKPSKLINRKNRRGDVVRKN